MKASILKLIQAIEQRSQKSRQDYLQHLDQMQAAGSGRKTMACSNLAHAEVGLSQQAQAGWESSEKWVNLGILTAYNDMLSAHQPYEAYPKKIKKILENHGASAQVAAGVPAMCDGVTQGTQGMELSLLSREVIAQSAVIGLSHGVFDAVVALGVCDKIVPGLLMGALAQGHLPLVFLSAGCMPVPSISHSEKNKIRQDFAEKKVDEKILLAAEKACYHSAGTCTFYGTANTNQVMLEALGLQMIGTGFLNPSQTKIQWKNHQQALLSLIQVAHAKNSGVGYLLTARHWVNAMAAILATGGSSNHSIHLNALARASGWNINWDDWQTLSDQVPLLAKIYPSSTKDVNAFHQAGGVRAVLCDLAKAGLVDASVLNFTGSALLDLNIKISSRNSDAEVLRSIDAPFATTGGLVCVKGNLGRGISKISSVMTKDQEAFQAPCVVFDEQHQVVQAFESGLFVDDVFVVVRQQGPKANGMPELHALMPLLGALQKRGLRVALITDGRLSGASGGVPSVVHLSPESAAGGFLAYLKTGDRLFLDLKNQILNHQVDEKVWAKRLPLFASKPELLRGQGMFAPLRQQMRDAESGASCLGWDV
jgi:phosphogluconate dehydratase